MTGKIPVSVVIATRNEAENITGCLDSLAAFDERVVVDSDSTDATVALAVAAGARVEAFHWDGTGPRKRRWCLEQLTLRHRWMLFVDADERMEAGLEREIAALMARGPECDGYFIALRYVFLSRAMNHGHRVWKLVLFDRNKVHMDSDPGGGVGRGGELEGHYQPTLTGCSGRLRGRLLHDDHRSLYQYFARHNDYSDWEARLIPVGPDGERAKETTLGWRGMAKRWFVRAGFWLGPLAFIHSYILKAGFLDGAAGLHYALARGVYYWQVALKRRERAIRGQTDTALS